MLVSVSESSVRITYKVAMYGTNVENFSLHLHLSLGCFARDWPLARSERLAPGAVNSRFDMIMHRKLRTRSPKDLSSPLYWRRQRSRVTERTIDTQTRQMQKRKRERERQREIQSTTSKQAHSTSRMDPNTQRVSASATISSSNDDAALPIGRNSRHVSVSTPPDTWWHGMLYV